MKHVLIVELNIDNIDCYAIRSMRHNIGKARGKFFFTAYKSEEKAIEVARAIDTTYEPIDETVNLNHRIPGKII